ncbi:hypothetical protein F511_31224 [Dorcoceras hygrometricum]|uniref:Uncharacterized protein n=1 Tax=Dorcoceras hygrometricum TaxID=472368 RepID=A0A2Z7B5B0_9LAMI|nr:hypothetical protein F511_31224 [Dorcoceras hygrometricum]
MSQLCVGMLDLVIGSSRNPSHSGVGSVHSCAPSPLEACQEPLIVRATSGTGDHSPPSFEPQTSQFSCIVPRHLVIFPVSKLYRDTLATVHRTLSSPIVGDRQLRLKSVLPCFVDRSVRTRMLVEAERVTPVNLISLLGSVSQYERSYHGYSAGREVDPARGASGGDDKSLKERKSKAESSSGVAVSPSSGKGMRKVSSIEEEGSRRHNKRVLSQEPSYVVALDLPEPVTSSTAIPEDKPVVVLHEALNFLKVSFGHGFHEVPPVRVCAQLANCW